MAARNFTRSIFLLFAICCLQSLSFQAAAVRRPLFHRYRHQVLGPFLQSPAQAPPLRLNPGVTLARPAFLREGGLSVTALLSRLR
jgi:hypothetical protein